MKKVVKIIATNIRNTLFISQIQFYILLKICKGQMYRRISTRSQSIHKDLLTVL